MTRITYILAALAVALVTAVSPTAASAEPTSGNANQCVPIRPEFGFYEAGRVATEELTTPTSRCRVLAAR